MIHYLHEISVRIPHCRQQRPWIISLVLGYCLVLAIGLARDATASPYSDQVIADGAIHYWRFEETATDQEAKDEISGVAGQENNPGIYEGGVELGHESAHPGLGKAVRFDGTDGTHVFLGEPQHPGDSMTAEAWFLLEADITTNFSPIFARWDGSYELDINHTSNGVVGEEHHVDFVIRNTDNTFMDPASEDAIVFDQWHHVAAVMHGESDGGGGTGIVYLDGVPGDSFIIEAGGDLQDAGGDDGFWYIGRTRRPASGFHWLGLIDEVAVYDRALTEEEIKRHIELAPLVGDGGQGPLQAGDADQDLDFDQLDLVQVQIAGKYLSGQTATWGEGDWNGAPGGSVGSPPAGDNAFDQRDIIAALAAGKYLTGPYLAINKGGARGDGQTSVVYDANTGEVAVDAPGGVQLTSVNIDSAGGIFTGDAAANLGGSFDNDGDNNIFKATFGGSFGSISFGNVAQSSLSEDFIAADLTVVGSLAGGGDLGAVDLVYIAVPEPSTVALVCLGLMGMLSRTRAWRSGFTKAGR